VHARESQARRRLRAASDDTRVSSAIGRETSCRVTPRGAAPRRADGDEEASRVENAMHYARHVRRQHASPPRRVMPCYASRPEVSLFLALNSCKSFALINVSRHLTLRPAKFQGNPVSWGFSWLSIISLSIVWRADTNSLQIFTNGISKKDFNLFNKIFYDAQFCVI